MTEEWRPVVGLEGFYEVSDQGRVRSLDRVITDSRGRSRLFRGCPKVSRLRADGYVDVRLHLGRGAGRTKMVHILMAEAFFGPCPGPDFQVCHNNGVRDDNRLENLRWDTRSSNQRDRFKHGTNHEKNKTHCPRGHPLEAPNLTSRSVEQGWRVCKSCSRARALIRTRPDLSKVDLQEVSDHYYAKLVAAEGSGLTETAA